MSARHVSIAALSVALGLLAATLTGCGGGSSSGSCDIAHCKDSNCKDTCSTCEDKYKPMKDDKGGYCGLDCPVDNCAVTNGGGRGATDCSKAECTTCSAKYELTLDTKTLLPLGACKLSCTDDQIVNGCVERTCKADKSCQCVPGFKRNPVLVSSNVERFLSGVNDMESCVKEDHTVPMTYYMYRAQNNELYPPDSTNLASAAGVLWYLHNEVVRMPYENQPDGSKTPRHNGITRILRYKVKMHNSPKIHGNPRQGQFNRFVQFDNGKCTYDDNKCDDLWKAYGYSVGCQWSHPDASGAVPMTYEGNYWYSLPGACPSETYVEKTSDPKCMKKQPGGSHNCSDPTGADDCTWSIMNVSDPDVVYLDELSGLNGPPYDPKFFIPWASDDNHVEYNSATDKGNGCSFWDDKANPARNKDRVLRLLQLFAKHYPTKDAFEFPDPTCDGF